jgi:hypothetical protein
MKILATFKAKYLGNGHLSIPEDIASSLLLKKGEEVQVVIGKESFDKGGFLKLSGIWKEKSEAEIHIYRKILKEREKFGRGDIEL